MINYSPLDSQPKQGETDQRSQYVVPESQRENLEATTTEPIHPAR